MPLASFLGEIIKSGKVTVSTNNTEAVEIKAANKKIDIKALDKEFVKSTLAAVRGNEKKGIRESIKGTVEQIKNARDDIEMVKSVAEELSQAGITVTFSYKNSVVVTLGSEANPKISKVATKTKAIEINSPRKLVELGI